MLQKKPPLSLGGDPIYARVCDKLREEILSGVFVADERLKIVDLSERYNVSMMPIREALQQLQGEGLVVLEPNKGARVRAVDDHFIENMYEIRSAIDGLLMNKIAQAITPEEIKIAAELNEEYEAAVSRANWQRALDLNKQFHHMLYQIADNPEAMLIIERHWRLIDSLRRKYGFGPGRSSVVTNEHKQLLAALVARDGKLAEGIARRHTDEAKVDLLGRLHKAAAAEEGRAVPSRAEASRR